MSYVFTPSEDADPALVNAFQARLAKLKPACTRCGRVLTKKELATRQCAERGDCVLRQIFREVPLSAYERPATRYYNRIERKPLALAEVHKLRDFLARQTLAADEGFPVLPPACLRCGKKLSPRELAAGRECSGRAACTKRMILSFKAPSRAEIYASAWFDALSPAEDEEAIAA